MPVQYTTITDEHLAVRKHVGLFDISHMGRLPFDGPEARRLARFRNDQSRREAPCRTDSVQPDGERGRRTSSTTFWSIALPTGHLRRRLQCLESQESHRSVRCHQARAKRHIRGPHDQNAMIAVQGPDAMKAVLAWFFGRSRFLKVLSLHDKGPSPAVNYPSAAQATPAKTASS